MVRLLPIKEIAERKKLLLVQSDIHRRTMQLHFAVLQESASHLKKRFAILGVSSVALSLGASVAGLLAAKKSTTGKPGIFGKILSGVSLFNQIKGLFRKMKPGAGEVE